jgi:glutamyl-tRNA synthetase
MRSHGFPTYHLAHLLDDHHMRITHVMRADEWLSSTPRHILLYQALGYVAPVFAHLPIILGTDKSKLSKRHGATSVLAYREMGYLPEALVNFMALLGWSLDDKTEVIPRDVLIKNFSLERIGKAGAIFNIEKLTWLNGVYIRQLAAQELADRLLPFLEKDLPPDVPRPIDIAYLRQIVPLIQERLKTLAEGSELTDCFFLESLKYDSSLLVQKGIDKTKTLLMLKKALEAVSFIQDFNAPDLEQTFRRLGSELNFHTREFFGTVRVALTGRTATPPLFQTMEVLGRERCAKRLQAAVQKLSHPD